MEGVKAIYGAITGALSVAVGLVVLAAIVVALVVAIAVVGFWVVVALGVFLLFYAVVRIVSPSQKGGKDGES